MRHKLISRTSSSFTLIVLFFLTIVSATLQIQITSIAPSAESVVLAGDSIEFKLILSEQRDDSRIRQSNFFVALYKKRPFIADKLVSKAQLNWDEYDMDSKFMSGSVLIPENAKNGEYRLKAIIMKGNSFPWKLARSKTITVKATGIMTGNKNNWISQLWKKKRGNLRGDNVEIVERHIKISQATIKNWDLQKLKFLLFDKENESILKEISGADLKKPKNSDESIFLDTSNINSPSVYLEITNEKNKLIYRSKSLHLPVSNYPDHFNDDDENVTEPEEHFAHMDTPISHEKDNDNETPDNDNEKVKEEDDAEDKSVSDCDLSINGFTRFKERLSETQSETNYFGSNDIAMSTTLSTPRDSVSIASPALSYSFLDFLDYDYEIDHIRLLGDDSVVIQLKTMEFVELLQSMSVSMVVDGDRHLEFYDMRENYENSQVIINLGIKVDTKVHVIVKQDNVVQMETNIYTNPVRLLTCQKCRHNTFNDPKQCRNCILDKVQAAVFKKQYQVIGIILDSFHFDNWQLTERKKMVDLLLVGAIGSGRESYAAQLMKSHGQFIRQYVLPSGGLNSKTMEHPFMRNILHAITIDDYELSTKARLNTAKYIFDRVDVRRKHELIMMMTLSGRFKMVHGWLNELFNKGIRNYKKAYLIIAAIDGRSETVIYMIKKFGIPKNEWPMIMKQIRTYEELLNGLFKYRQMWVNPGSIEDRIHSADIMVARGADPLERDLMNALNRE